MITALLADGMNNGQYVAYWVLCITCLVLIFLAALITIIVVLVQKSNSDGIQGITASSETFFGKNKGRSMESKLKKWSWILLGVIAVLAIVVYIVQLIAP
ncbi:MAG: preprotein translocase subunit SecG [Clostridia bacterium]|nr:preprotein translocase subunit SecG [Clostridia bacterium]